MQYLILVANCFPVKGHKRSIICDTSRNKYEFIPNSLYDFINKYNKCPLNKIKEDFGNSEDWAIIETYLEFLEKKEFIFYSDKPELFTKIEMKWESPLQITNSIIDFDEASSHDLKSIIRQLNDLYCEALEFRDFFGMSTSFISEMVALTKDSSCRSIYLILKYNGPYQPNFLENLIKGNRRIMSILVHSAPEGSDGLQGTAEEDEWYNITYSQEKLTDETHCGSISKWHFTTSMAMFMESHFFNSCLNRKLSIDKKGYIRNCPSSPSQFGHHKNTLLTQALQDEQFAKYWNITKDQVSVCKSCEFRYICTDCRVYVEDPMDVLSKPSKCSYNPYTASWAD